MHSSLSRGIAFPLKLAKLLRTVIALVQLPAISGNNDESTITHVTTFISMTGHSSVLMLVTMPFCMGACDTNN